MGYIYLVGNWVTLTPNQQRSWTMDPYWPHMTSGLKGWQRFSHCRSFPGFAGCWYKALFGQNYKTSLKKPAKIYLQTWGLQHKLWLSCSSLPATVASFKLATCRGYSVFTSETRKFKTILYRIHSFLQSSHEARDVLVVEGLARLTLNAALRSVSASPSTTTVVNLGMVVWVVEGLATLTLNAAPKSVHASPPIQTAVNLGTVVWMVEDPVPQILTAVQTGVSASLSILIAVKELVGDLERWIAIIFEWADDS